MQSRSTRLMTSALVLFAIAGAAQGQLLAPPPGNATGTPAAASPIFGGQSKISFDRISHDFGDVVDDANVETNFTFTNTGDTPLEILDHRATCGCTVPEISNRNLLPGESANIKVVFHPAHKRGKQHQTVTLITNSTEQPQVQLTVHANVKPLTWTEPTVVHFSRIDKGGTRTVELEVISRVKDFKIESFKISNPVTFTAELGEPVEFYSEEEGETLRKHTITIGLAQTAPIGNHNETISIRTNDPRKLALNQQIIAEVVGDILPVPNRVSLGVVRPMDPMLGEVRVSSRSGKPFKIERAIPHLVTGGSVEVEVVPDPASPEGTGYKLLLTGVAPDRIQPVRGEIELRTDNKDQPSIRIPIYATVRGGGNQAVARPN